MLPCSTQTSHAHLLYANTTSSPRQHFRRSGAILSPLSLHSFSGALTFLPCANIVLVPASSFPRHVYFPSLSGPLPYSLEARSNAAQDLSPPLCLCPSFIKSGRKGQRLCQRSMTPPSTFLSREHYLRSTPILSWPHVRHYNRPNANIIAAQVFSSRSSTSPSVSCLFIPCKCCGI